MSKPGRKFLKQYYQQLTKAQLIDAIYSMEEKAQNLVGQRNLLHAENKELKKQLSDSKL